MTVIGEARPATREISVGALLWFVLGAVFVLVRLAGRWMRTADVTLSAMPLQIQGTSACLPWSPKNR